MSRRTLLPIFTTGLSLTTLSAVSADVHATQVFTENFTPGHNEGDWTFGEPTKLAQDLTNQNFFLEADTYPAGTWAPILVTKAVESIFQGDYRKKNVTALSADAKWFDTYINNPFDLRPLSLVLIHDDYAAYQESTSPLRSAYEKWNTFDFTLPKSSDDLEKTGWKVVQWPEMWADADKSHFEEILKDVQQVRFYYADPTRIYMIQNFKVGITNVSIEYAG